MIYNDSKGREILYKLTTCNGNYSHVHVHTMIAKGDIYI